MAKFKPYSKYKDSGLEWIGEVPEHWNLKPLKSLLMDGKDGVKIGPFGSSLKLEEFDEGFPYKVYGQENIINDDFSAGSRFISQEKYAGMEVYKLKPGDIIISMMGTIGRCKVVPLGVNPGIMDSHLIRIRVNKNFLSPEFLQYVIDESNYIKEQFFVSSTGSIMSGLNSSIVKNVFVITPSIPEQQAIADFLDQKTSEIDGLVADKEKLVSLLQEYRQAIISEAVTKGLNPDVKMKDSGVEWIGEIPEHWEKTVIKRLAKDSYSFMDGDWIESPYIVDSGIRLLQTGNIGIGHFKEQGYRYISEETFKALKCKYVLPDDVLICRLAEPVGRACLAPNLEESMITSVDVCILRPKEDIDSRFIVYSLSSPEYLEYMAITARGGTRQRVSRLQLGNTAFYLPPLSELQAIADYLDQKTSEIDDLISGIQESIDQLKSYRQSLISEAVTGKIDVRGVI